MLVCIHADKCEYMYAYKHINTCMRPHMHNTCTVSLHSYICTHTYAHTHIYISKYRMYAHTHDHQRKGSGGRCAELDVFRAGGVGLERSTELQWASAGTGKQVPSIGASVVTVKTDLSEWGSHLGGRVMASIDTDWLEVPSLCLTITAEQCDLWPLTSAITGQEGGKQTIKAVCASLWGGHWSTDASWKWARSCATVGELWALFFF